MRRKNTMEFSFDYYWWLQNIDKEPPIMVFFSSFGVIGILLVLALIRSLIKVIGFKRLADSKILDGIMISLALAGFFGFIIILFLIFSIEEMNVTSQEEHGGIRLALIWMTLFIFILFFYFSKRNIFNKWFSGITAFSENSEEEDDEDDEINEGNNNPISNRMNKRSKKEKKKKKK